MLLNKKSICVIIYLEYLYSIFFIGFTLDYTSNAALYIFKAYTRMCNTRIKQPLDYMISSIITKYFPYRTSLFPEKIFISIFMSQYRQLYYASGF